jgi:hypothetical protein
MRRIVTSFPFLLQAAVGQGSAGLAVTADDPELGRIVADLAAAAAPPPPPAVAGSPGGGAAIARHVLGRLRAGDLAAAQSAVAAARARAAAADATAADRWWFVLAVGWCIDASEDELAARSLWPSVQPVARRLAAAPAALQFADECLVIQALFATAALRLRLGRSGVDWADLALARMARLETVAAQRMRGRYASSPTSGLATRRSHPRADVRDLDPTWFGLQSALPMRQQHDRTALAELTAAAAADPAADTLTAAAMRLAAAATLRDGPARHAAYLALRRLAATPDSPGAAACALDALLLAVTGVRQATDFTLEDGFVLMAPWLPTGVDTLRVCGMTAHGAVFDLECERRTGPLQADERDVTACLGVDRPRVVATIALHRSVGGGPRLFVVHGDWQGAAHEVAVGERWVASLPTLQLDAQHEPR